MEEFYNTIIKIFNYFISSESDGNYLEQSKVTFVKSILSPA